MHTLSVSLDCTRQCLASTAWSMEHATVWQLSTARRKVPNGTHRNAWQRPEMSKNHRDWSSVWSFVRYSYASKKRISTRRLQQWQQYRKVPSTALNAHGSPKSSKILDPTLLSRRLWHSHALHRCSGMIQVNPWPQPTVLRRLPKGASSRNQRCQGTKTCDYQPTMTSQGRKKQ